MMPASLISGDRNRVCPYDATHSFPAKSFNAHLLRCRQNNRHVKKKTCPLDSTHIIPGPELNYHLTSECDKRCLLDRELQKKAAGDSFLSGDVHGPPIVADHFAGQRDEEEENWDDLPQRMVPTPALFNKKVANPQPPAGAYVPPGGYNPSHKTEPEIRKIPNAPAKAAALSNPWQARPAGPSHVFNYSLGLAERGRGTVPMRMPRMTLNPGGGNPLVPPVAWATTGSQQMAGVKGPGVNQGGPRFIGRGISKYATKTTATIGEAVSPGSLILPAESSSPSRQAKTSGTATATAGNTSTSPSGNKGKGGSPTPQKGKKKNNKRENKDSNTDKTNNTLNTAVPKPPGFADELSSSPALKDEEEQETAAMLEQLELNSNLNLNLNPVSDQMDGLSLTQRQQLLHQAVLLHQKNCQQQQEQQKLKLAQKHQLQLLQLQKLQAEEAQRMAAEQERVQQALSSLVLMDATPNAGAGVATLVGAGPADGNKNANTGGSGGSEASVSSTSPGVLDAILMMMNNSGGVPQASDISCNITQGVSSALDVSSSSQAVPTPETWHEDSSNSISAPVQSSDTVLRATRDALEKQMHQISILQQKSLLGHMLSAEEELQLKEKDKIQAQLTCLSSQKT